MGRERNNAPGPFTFRGCDLTAECLLATERMSGCDSRQPHQFPSIIRLAAHQLVQQSLQNSACSGAAPEAACQFSISGSWQTSNALALQASSCGSVTHRLHHFTAGNSTKDRAKPHKLLQVGATPTPATNFGRCSGCRSVKPVSQNKCRK